MKLCQDSMVNRSYGIYTMANVSALHEYLNIFRVLGRVAGGKKTHAVLYLIFRVQNLQRQDGPEIEGPFASIIKVIIIIYSTTLTVTFCY